MDTMQAVIALLENSLWGNRIELQLDTADWATVFKEMKKHTIAALAGDILAEYNLVPNIKHEWFIEVLSQLSRNERVFSGQDKLIELLNTANIPVAILKGAAAARYYPHPEYRTQGDVDFIVPQDRFEEALTLMLANGYMQCTDLLLNCEIALRKDDVH